MLAVEVGSGTTCNAPAKLAAGNALLVHKTYGDLFSFGFTVGS